eukprot:TRINITY_DN93960_c0_g1_i1.p1 TRINITY_DN93960_c0_g1~~TRINITY_DN93960_c0_g1_i1.p1  ORF type:complete len:156 (+),score=23.65 TRINITY_DN93960_c0_g1_i1:142-609(+)
MAAFSQCYQLCGAIHALERMQASQLEPNVVSFNTLVNAQARVCDTAAALRVLDSMRSQLVLPDLVTHAALLKSYAGKGDFTGARQSVDAMVAAGHKPDLACYSMLQSAASKLDEEGRAEAEQWILEDMARSRVSASQLSHRMRSATAGSGARAKV